MIFFKTDNLPTCGCSAICSIPIFSHWKTWGWKIVETRLAIIAVGANWRRVLSIKLVQDRVTHRVLFSGGVSTNHKFCSAIPWDYDPLSLTTNLPPHSLAPINTQFNDLFIQARYSAAYATDVANRAKPYLVLAARHYRSSLETRSTEAALTTILTSANLATSTVGYFKVPTEDEWSRILQDRDPRILEVIEKGILTKEYRDICSLSGSS